MNDWSEIADSLYELIKETQWIWVVLFLLIIFIIAWLIFRKGHIVVPKTQVAVVYNTDTHGFSRFLPPGRHVLLPGVELVRGIISGEISEVRGCCHVRAKNGYPITLGWRLTYRLAPLSIDPVQSVDSAHVLLNKTQNVVILETNECLNDLLEHYTLDPRWDIGFHDKVKRQLTLQVADRLNRYGIEIERIGIDLTNIPDEIEAKRLAKLVRAIRVSNGNLSEAEIAKLIRLNQYRKQDQGQSIPKPVHKNQPSSQDLADRIQSPDIDYQDSLTLTAIQGVNIPNDGSIGKIVI